MVAVKPVVLLLSVMLFSPFSSSLSVIGADAGNGIRVFIPDIGMFVAGLVIWLLCRSLVQKRPPEDMAQYNADFVAEEQVSFFYLFYFLFSSDTKWLCTVLGHFHKLTEMGNKLLKHTHVCTQKRLF